MSSLPDLPSFGELWQQSFVVWIGLAAFGFGLPLGGLVTVRRRRRSPVTRGLRARGLA